MAYREEIFVFQGISLNEIIYFFFVGKGTYSIFFLHPVRGGILYEQVFDGRCRWKVGKRDLTIGPRS